MEIERTQIHFLSAIFMAVTIVVSQTPYYYPHGKTHNFYMSEASLSNQNKL